MTVLVEALGALVVVVRIKIIIVVIKGTLARPHALESGVIHLDFAAMEVCHVEVVCAVPFGNRAALVDGAFRGVVNDDRCRGPAIPSRDGALFGDKDEPCRRRRAAGQRKIRSAIEDHSGRGRRRAAAWWNGDGHNKAQLGACAVIESGESGVVVGHPPGAGNAARQAPCVDELRIEGIRGVRTHTRNA